MFYENPFFGSLVNVKNVRNTSIFCIALNFALKSHPLELARREPYNSEWVKETAMGQKKL